MSVGLSGNLVDFGIADVFQLIGQQRKTGMLELRSDGARVQLLFANGMVVSAAPAVARTGDLDPLVERLVRSGQLARERADEAMNLCKSSAQTLPRVLASRGWVDEAAVRDAEELVTRDTIFDVLRWQSGSFDFLARDVAHDRNPAELLGAEQILMDGLRMVDEWQSYTALVPDEEVVYARTGSFERFLESQPRLGDEERERAERVFGLIDGQRSARRVIDLARLGTFDGIRCLAELHQGGAVRVVEGELGVSAVDPLDASGSERGWFGQAVAAVVPLLLLAGVVGWGATSPTVAPDPAHIRHTSFESLRLHYVTQTVRAALEAYRLEHGRWPADLANLERAGLLEPGWLASQGGGPYYSLHRELGPLLLAPEWSVASVPSRGSP